MYLQRYKYVPSIYIAFEYIPFYFTNFIQCSVQPNGTYYPFLCDS